MQPLQHVSERARSLKVAVIGARDEFLTEVTLHVLRHTCASRLVQRSVPIYTVSKWLGHSSVKVTERYAKLAPESPAMALQALGKPSTPVTAEAWAEKEDVRFLLVLVSQILGYNRVFLQ